MAVLAVLWRPGFEYKRAGVVLLDLVPAVSAGGGLFDPPDDDRSHARMQALDALDRRCGRGMVTFGATGRERQGWGMKREFHSPRHTTSGRRCWVSDEPETIDNRPSEADPAPHARRNWGLRLGSGPFLRRCRD